jgi:FAD/FMN-containing dehydrogenase
VEADLGSIRRIAEQEGGREIENSIPKILRANPFPPVNSMLGPAGERWVPVHGFLPHSRLQECWAAIQALFGEHGVEMDRLGVGAGAMLAGVSRSACLLEPVFFWPDAAEELHRRSVEPAHLARLKQYPANPQARALVAHLRGALVDLFGRLGATHLQIARTYKLKEAHHPAAWELLRALKAAVDPKGLMNPGSLGL